MTKLFLAVLVPGTRTRPGNVPLFVLPKVTRDRISRMDVEGREIVSREVLVSRCVYTHTAGSPDPDSR